MYSTNDCVRNTTFDKRKILSPEEERELFRRYVEEGDLAARDEIADSYLYFVRVLVMTDYANSGFEYEELLSEGAMGLMRAFEKFDYTRGFRFSTYAGWWIRERIRRYIRKNSIDGTGRLLSLQQEVGEDGSELSDFVASIQTRPDSVVEKKEMIQALHYAINTCLNDRERRIIVERFGLYGEYTHTTVEISKADGVTRQRIYAIENRAFRKLKKAILNYRAA